MKRILQLAAAVAMMALGACSTSLDTAAPAPAAFTGQSVALPADVPQFAANSAGLADVLAEGGAKKVSYVRRGQAIITGAVAANCPYGLGAGVYTAAAAPLRAVGGSRTYRFTNY